MRVSIPMHDWNEKQWQDFLIGSKGQPGLARVLGYRCYHTLRSKGSEPGWPDWALVRPGRFVLLELKHDAKASKLSDAQKEWVLALIEGGVEVYVPRPRNLAAIQHVLQAKTRPTSGPELDELLQEIAKETT